MDKIKIEFTPMEVILIMAGLCAFQEKFEDDFNDDDKAGELLLRVYAKLHSYIQDFEMEGGIYS